MRVLIAPLLIFSFVTNAAILVSPIFMMQVLDRVVPSGNLNTLFLLLAVALLAIAFNAFVETGRDLSLQRVARWAESICTGPILALPPAQQTDMLGHLGQARGFIAGGSATALLNLFWLPLFIGVLGLIHLSYVVLVATLVATMLGVQHLRDTAIKAPSAQINQLRTQERRWVRLLETLNPLTSPQHLRNNLNTRLQDAVQSRQTYESQSDRPLLGGNGALTGLRMSAQLLAMSIGAYLVSQGKLSAGAMIAASLIAAKTITTIEQALGALRSWPDAKDALTHLQNLAVPQETQMDISELSGALKCERLIYPRGGGAPPRLDRISFELSPGDCLAIIGDAGSGKSTLLQALAGLDPAPIGSVVLDQTDVRHMSATTRRAMIGYLPQMGGLLPGTVAENIAGFDTKMNDKAIIAAAKKAKVHGMISALPQGYQTDIGATPHLLTAGQKQHVALAAAIYCKPKYLFLDEPNALLDKNGERAMCETIADLKDDGVTVVMVLHRAGAIGLADHILVLERGFVSDFGPRAQVLGRQSDGRRLTRMPLRKTSLQDLSDWITGQFTRSNDAEFAAKAAMLGTEMFLAANLNGPQDKPREVEIQFRFLDDRNCELQIVEQGQTSADKLLRQVKSQIECGHEGFEKLGEKAMPLFLASKLAARFEIRNENNLAQFSARIVNDDAPEPEGRPH